MDVDEDEDGEVEAIAKPRKNMFIDIDAVYDSD